MLEILILILLAKKIGRIAREKGRKKGRYQFLLVALWIGGEVFGAILGGILMALAGDDDNAMFLFVLALTYGSAIIGAVVAFQIVKNLEPVNEYEGFPLPEVELSRWGERFSPKEPTPRGMEEGYTDRPERTPRSGDDRIQP